MTIAASTHHSAVKKCSADELIARSLNDEHKVGAGSEGIVYRIADPDFDAYLIKCNRSNKFRRSRTDQQERDDEENALRQIKSTTSLFPAGNRLQGGKYGQALMVEPDHRFSILQRQEGIGVKSMFGEAPHVSFAERYRNYLQWMLRDVPDKALIDLNAKMQHAQQCGYFLDPDKSNLLWDVNQQCFNIIDLHDKTHSMFASRSITVHTVYRAMTRGDRMTPSEAVYDLVTYCGIAKHLAVLRRMSATEHREIGSLENRLRERLEGLLPQISVKTLPQKPRETLQIEGLENLGTVSPQNLKAKLDEIRNAYGLS